MKPLYELYRPKSFAEVVGQDEALKKLDHLRRRGGLSGHVYWITGQSGTGKTTIARLIAAEVGDEWVIEVDSSDVMLDTVREWERRCYIPALGLAGARGQYVFLVNEAQELRRDILGRLNTLLETEVVQRKSTWIFTYTTENASDTLFEKGNARPFLSRVCDIPLSRLGLAKAFAERAKEIAQKEGLDGKPIEAYVKLAQKHHNNFRAMLTDVEMGAMCE